MKNLSAQNSEAVKEQERKRERERLLYWFFSFMTSLDTLSLLFVDGVSLRVKEAPSIRLFREMEWRPRRQKELERERERVFLSSSLCRTIRQPSVSTPTDRPKYDPTQRRWDTKVSKGKKHHRILQRMNKILRLIFKVEIGCQMLSSLTSSQLVSTGALVCEMKSNFFPLKVLSPFLRYVGVTCRAEWHFLGNE